MKRVLVTGASGFVGTHLVSYLHKKGFQIWASEHRRLGNFAFPVHWVRTDLTSREEVLHLLQVSHPHYIFHLAGQSIPSESWKNFGLIMRLNVMASIFLLEGMVRCRSKARILLASSAQVYGTTFAGSQHVREDETANPTSPYAGSKLLLEMAALNFARTHGIDLVIARSLNCVGSGQTAGTVFADFSKQVVSIERGRKPAVVQVGHLNVVRDFLHVDDAVRAYALLAQRARRGGIYNVASGQGVTLQKAVNFLAQKSRARFQIKRVQSRFRKNDVPYAVADTTKLRRLGWSPKKTVWDGLEEVLEDCRTQ